MSDREELMALRRMAELEAKAGGTQFSPPQSPMEHQSPPFRPDVKTPQDSRALPMFKAGLVEDPATKLRVAAETMYPGDPKATDRVGMVGGRMVTVNDAGELEYVADKWGEFGANLAANIPEIVAGTAGALSGMPVIGSTLGVMGARGLKRGVAGLAFDEPQTITGNLKSVGREGAINLATATAGKGLAGVANRGRQVDFTPVNLAEARALQAEVKKKWGIDLNLAQATEDPQTLAMWRYLARYPRGTSASTAGKFTEAQDVQMEAAMDALLQKFGPGYPSETLGREATATAKKAIAQARKELSDEVRPLYDAAYAEVPSVTDPAIVALTKRPSFAGALDKARKMLADEGMEYKPDQLDLRLLDKTKQSLDDAIESASRGGNLNEARVLRGQKKQLVDWLDNASGQKYKEARSAYEAGMKSRIEPLEKGVVGVLSRIDDPKAATAAVKIMRDPNISGREILQAKGVILKQPNGAETWDGLVRQYLSSSWNAAQKVSQKGVETNPGGKMFQTVAGNPNQRTKLVAMLGQERGDLAMDLFETFRKISTSEVTGSDTAFNQIITDAFRSPLARTAKVALSPRQTAMDAADRASMDRLTGLVAEAMTDPAKVRQLRAVVQMPASQKKLYLLGTILTGKAADAAVSRSGDQLPPSYTPR